MGTPGTGWLEQFRDSLGFELDPFQTDACRALVGGESVLVSAPTGAGKTIVGEFAVFMALKQGSRVFYTTPIKALGNQKFKELTARFGAGRVGLLTGDTSINAHSQVIVMTIEVLRNMLYADPQAPPGLACVVLDEAHYLSDPTRGTAWEEVILLLPPHVPVIALSATISNADEVGAWLATARGPTSVVVSEHRPVPLFHHVMAGREIFDLFQTPANGTPKNIAQLNPNLSALTRHGRTNVRADDEAGERGRTRHLDRLFDSRRGRARGVAWGPVIRGLQRRGYLPAIAFVFSQAGCDAAVRACVDAGVRLPGPEARRRIEQQTNRIKRLFSPDELAATDFEMWRQGLRCGVGAHHAGLLPVFKTTVEQLFAEGLLGVVFATDTLALGINMPAKAVVLEQLAKFNGHETVPLSAAEYTQLAGRAGRRGIDVEGHAIVLWQPGTDPAELAQLASGASLPLVSGFRPTYNMCINLIARHGLEESRRLMTSSFACFQHDRISTGGQQQASQSGPRGGGPVRPEAFITESHDRTVDVLAHYGYLRMAAGKTEATGKGQRLRGIHGESGLLVDLTLDSGAFDGLNPTELAAFSSIFVYRSASSGRKGQRRMPGQELQEALEKAMNVWTDLQLTEERHQLAKTPEPETGLAHAMHSWAGGLSLQDTLSETNNSLSAGAFAYWANRCVNLLEQLARTKPVPPALVPGLHQAAHLIRRGALGAADAGD
jgi:superfamily II RNA helicase